MTPALTYCRDESHDDVAVQRFVLEGFGFKADPSVILLNREYAYDGRSFDLEELFMIVDVTAETDAFMEGIPSEVQAQLEVLSRDKAPDIHPRPQCVKPFQREFYDLCNKSRCRRTIYRACRAYPRRRWSNWRSWA